MAINPKTGKHLDLEITIKAGSEYATHNSANTKIANDMFQINQRVGYESTFVVTVKDHDTGDPVTLDAFYFSFLDIDTGAHGVVCPPSVAEYRHAWR